ncbi:MAG: hypothetical protein RL136_2306 [Planctomycetota bacterium]
MGRATMDFMQNGANGSDLARLQERILAFVAEREWQQFHDPKNLSMAVAVEAGELMDHFRWLRNDESLKALDDARTRTEVEEEVADVMILLLEFASVCGIDVAAAVERKLEINARKYPVELARGNAVKPARRGGV